MQDNLSSFIEKFNKHFSDSRYIYICNDPERALGLEKLIPNYQIAHIDLSQYLDDFNSNSIKYFCWQEHENTIPLRSSIKLIRSSQFLDYFNLEKDKKTYIQTFKISPAFQQSVANLGAVLVNTTAELNRMFEDKLSQYEILSKLAITLPKGGIYFLEQLDYGNLTSELGGKFVIQFNKGHTGMGTKFIKSEQDLNELKAQFPGRQVRIAQFIEGQAYTLNACVGANAIYIGGLSKQITGDKDLTPYEGATIGNDWEYRAEINNENIKQIENDVITIGEAMRAKGYRGLFGIDLIINGEGKAFIIEINARQPASIPMYTKMQLRSGQIPLAMIHIAEFCGIQYVLDQNSYNQTNLAPQPYSQIFVRSFKDYELEYPLRSGVYRLQGDNAAIDRVSSEVKPDTIFLDEERDVALLFQNDGYSIDDIDQGGLLILTPAKMRKLAVNDELGRIQVNSSAHLPTGQLLSWIREALIAIKNYQS
jgi:glutathione synthase/RimK-type ligase-like ATP-grasp enzyme